MTKPEKNSKPGFVIKLSNETVQKLAEEEQLAKTQTEVAQAKASPVDTYAKEDAVQGDTSYSDESSGVSTKDVSHETNKKETLNSPKETPGSETDEKQDKTEDSNFDSTWGDYAPYVTYEGEEAIYTDPNTNQKYTWNKETNSWTSKPDDTPDRAYSYEDDTHIYTESDGSKFFWDADKKAWIPKVDDDFLAMYQMSYGFVDNSTPENKETKQDMKSEPSAGVKRKSEPQWFQPSEDTNTKVYVSNLPQDLTEEEFVNLMQKCGLVERDPSNQKMKVKLYMDKEHKCFKGDALCTYIKIESVDLALKLIDGCDYKGNKISVERALFQMKGDYNPALKPKKKKKKELEKLKKMQQKLFDWRPEKFIGERSKHERVVIVKNLFHPSDFDKDVQLILDYQQDLREECSKSGEVRKVVVYDGHPEGVAQITMKEPEQADAVVALINGRWFGKRQITAEIWDGRTKYRIAETDADIGKRIDKWGKFLDGKEEASKEQGSKESSEKGNTSSDKDPMIIEPSVSNDSEIKEPVKTDKDPLSKEPISVSNDSEMKEPVKTDQDPLSVKPSVSNDSEMEKPVTTE